MSIQFILIILNVRILLVLIYSLLAIPYWPTAPFRALTPGELAVDAVIATFELKRAAIVQSPLLLPAVMSSAWKAPRDQQAKANS